MDPPQATLARLSIAASAILRALYLQTVSLVASEEHLAEARKVVKSALRGKQPTAALTDSCSRAERCFDLDKSLCGNRTHLSMAYRNIVIVLQQQQQQR